MLHIAKLSNNRLIDGIDLEILRVLQQDGRISVSDLAERVGLTVAPTYRRLRRLEMDQVIDGYSALVDPAKLGLTIRAIVSVRFASHDLHMTDKFLAFVQSEPSVVTCDNVTGEVDYFLVVLVKDLADYEAFTHRLRATEGVTSIHTHISLRRIKDGFPALA